MRRARRHQRRVHPAELEALVNTAAAVHGDPDELSSHQRDLAARAYPLLQDAIDD